MNNDYYQLQELVFDSYIFNSPIEIEKGVLLLDKSTRQVILRLNLNILTANISEISSITLNIVCMDDAMDIITEINPFSFTYRDIFLLNAKSFGHFTPIVLDPRVRNVKVGIKRIVYLNSTIWYPSKEEIIPNNQIPIISLKPDLLDQFNRDISSLQIKQERIVFIPQQFDHYWLCTCGRPNKNEAEECCRCGFSKRSIFEIINERNIQKNLYKYKENLRLEAEKIQLEKEQAQQGEEQRVRQQAEEMRIRSKRRGKLLIIGGSLGVFFAIFILILLPAINYSIASYFLGEKEYNSAIYMFYSLGNYRNSEDMVNEANYQKANDLLVDNQYDESIKVFSFIGDYNDSKEMVNETKYQKAVDFFTQNKYAEALEIFGNLGKYQDSESQINKIKYAMGYQYIDDEDYERAITTFLELGDYEESENLLMEVKYSLASQYFEEFKFKEAIELFNNLGDYKDSMALLVQSEKGLENESEYKLAYTYYDEGDFEKAIQIFNSIPNYRDSTEYIGLLKTIIGIQGTWTGRFDYVFYGWRCFDSALDNPKVYSFIVDIPKDSVTSEGIVFNVFPNSTVFYLKDVKVIYITDSNVLTIGYDTYTKISDITSNSYILNYESNKP